MEGIVYKSTGSRYIIKNEQGNFVECRIKGKFRIEGIKSTNPIAVGDIIDYNLEQTTENEVGMIYNIRKRKNHIIRKAVNLSHQVHIIASNIDQVFLIITIDNPPTSYNFIDRFLVTAEAYGIKTILIFNKTDTFDKNASDQQRYMQYVYQKIGYHCLCISSIDKTGIDELKTLMANKVSLFSGHSGVGKSTLVNTLEPTLKLKTKEISQSSHQGQHSTTFAEMYDLSWGAKIIDTPGIKGFGVVEMTPSEIGGYFPEFFRLKNKCKFNNCLHKDEPQCAVKDALEQDEISWTRYNSYLKILDGDEENYRTDSFEEEREITDRMRNNK